MDAGDDLLACLRTSIDGEDDDILVDEEKKKEEEEEEAAAVAEDDPRPPDDQRSYHLISIGSAIAIRQLRSQGLSFQLWPAASTFVSLLDGAAPFSLLPPHLRRHGSFLRVLELGSGTGLVGIAAAAVLGARVTLTDLPHVLPNLRHNAEANAAVASLLGGSVEVRRLQWGDRGDMESLIDHPFDVVIASDVVYYEHLIDPLLETVGFFVNGGAATAAAFVMAHLRRWKKRDAMFFRKARKSFEVQLLHSDPPLPGCRTGVAVYSFTPKGREAA